MVAALSRRILGVICARRLRALLHALFLQAGNLCTMTHEAEQRVINCIGGQFVERWPASEAHAFASGKQLSYTERIALGTFLFGNLRDANLVYAAVREQLGPDPKDHDHMRRWLADLASGKYDERVYYYQVLHLPDFFFLSGARNHSRAPQQPFVRALNAWEAECVRMRREEGRWPSLGEQRAFLGM